MLGFKPVFIDSDLNNYNLLIGAIEPLINENKPYDLNSNVNNDLNNDLNKLKLVHNLDISNAMQQV